MSNGNDCLVFHELSLGGQLDYGIILNEVLENDESLDPAELAVTADSPADLQITSVSAPQSGTVGRKSIVPGQTITFRATSIGSTLGTQYLTVKVAGDSGTILHYRGTLDIVQFINACP